MAQRITQENILPYAKALLTAFVTRASSERDSKAYFNIPNMQQFSAAAYTAAKLAPASDTLHGKALWHLLEGKFVEQQHRRPLYRVLRTSDPDSPQLAAFIRTLDPKAITQLLSKASAAQRLQLEKALKTALFHVEDSR